MSRHMVQHDHTNLTLLGKKLDVRHLATEDCLHATSFSSAIGCLGERLSAAQTRKGAAEVHNDLGLQIPKPACKVFHFIPLLYWERSESL